MKFATGQSLQQQRISKFSSEKFYRIDSKPEPTLKIPHLVNVTKLFFYANDVGAK